MFNIRRIEPAFKEDMYGFTQSLLSYINGETNKTPDSEKLRDITHRAYHQGAVADQKIAQHALFIIYQSVLAHPLSAPASRQYDPALLEIKKIIENEWLEHEFGQLSLPKR